MAANDKDQITTMQTTWIVAKSIIGTGIIVLPRVISKGVGTHDGWISVLVSGFLAMLTGYIIVKLGQRFPNQTFFQYSQIVIGKPLGICISIFVSIDFIIRSGYVLRFMGEVVQIYLLNNTPLEVIMIVYLSLATYLTVGGLNPIARLIELFLPIVVILLLVLIAFSLRDFEIDNIRPVLGDGLRPVWKGIRPAVFSYSGFEIMLLLLAFMKKPREAIRSTLTGIGLATFLYTLVVMTAIGTLTVEEVKTVTWPTMSVAKNIELPGGFFERFESIFSVLWVLSMYTGFVLYQYVFSLGFSQILRMDYRKWVYASVPVIYLIAMFPSDLNSMFRLGDYLGKSAAYIIAVIPLSFWIIAKVRRKGIEN
jgi:spore germination protein